KFDCQIFREKSANREKYLCIFRGFFPDITTEEITIEVNSDYYYYFKIPFSAKPKFQVKNYFSVEEIQIRGIFIQRTFKVPPQSGRVLKINFELPKLQLVAIYTFK